MVQYFMAQIVPVLAIGSSFSWLLCPFDMSPSSCSLSTSLLSGTKDAPGSSCLSCTSPRINHFFSEPWFLLLEDGIRNQGAWLGIRICHLMCSEVWEPLAGSQWFSTLTTHEKHLGCWLQHGGGSSWVRGPPCHTSLYHTSQSILHVR